MSSKTKHNGSFTAKQRVRLRVRKHLHPNATIFEGFAGEGRIYRGCWAGYSGMCIDIDKTKAGAAAVERPRWTCIAGDTEKALKAGIASAPFDVVDLDAYGSPWKFVAAYLGSVRQFAATTHLILTDGYMVGGRGLKACKALYPDGIARTLSQDNYLEAAAKRFEVWTPAELSFEWAGTSVHSKMAMHHIILRKRA